MKTILLILTYAVGIGELILAIYFWVTNSKSEIRRVMALLAFSTAGWGITNALTDAHYTFIGVLPYVFGTLMLTTLLYFAVIFPYRNFIFDRLHTFFLYLPWVFFSFLILTTKTVLTDLYITNNASYTSPGSLFPVFNVYLALLYFSGMALMLWKVRNSEGLVRHNMVIVFWSLLLAGLPGVFFAILHMMKDVPFNYLYGPIASIFWLGATTYIVRKK